MVTVLPDDEGTCVRHKKPFHALLFCSGAVFIDGVTLNHVLRLMSARWQTSNNVPWVKGLLRRIEDEALLGLQRS